MGLPFDESLADFASSLARALDPSSVATLSAAATAEPIDALVPPAGFFAG